MQIGAPKIIPTIISSIFGELNVFQTIDMMLLTEHQYYEMSVYCYYIISMFDIDITD